LDFSSSKDSVQISVVVYNSKDRVETRYFPKNLNLNQFDDYLYLSIGSGNYPYHPSDRFGLVKLKPGDRLYLMENKQLINTKQITTLEINVDFIYHAKRKNFYKFDEEVFFKDYTNKKNLHSIFAIVIPYKIS